MTDQERREFYEAIGRGSPRTELSRRRQQAQYDQHVRFGDDLPLRPRP